MASEHPNVKEVAGTFKASFKDCRDWVDAHPRTGWYVAVVVTLDFLLHLMQAVG